MTHPPEGSAAEEKKADELGDGPKELSGSLFFALPNGQAIMYNLKGTSKPPDTEGVIEVTTTSLPCCLPSPTFLLPSASHVRLKLALTLIQTPTHFLAPYFSPGVDTGEEYSADHDPREELAS